MALRESTPLRRALEQLTILQEIDTESDRSVRKRTHLDSGQAVHARAQAALAESERARNDLAERQREMKDAELEQSGVEAKIRQYEQRQRTGQITNAKEVSNVQREIGQFIRQRSALDEKILTLMDEIEAGRVETERLERAAHQAEQEASTHAESYRAILSRIEAELNSLSSQRAGAATAVEDRTLLKRYETLRARPSSSGVALAKIVDKHCSACGNQVSANDADRVREAEVTTTCETCSRILASVE